jgi:dihydroorotase-like cyclic amidohydrolase
MCMFDLVLKNGLVVTPSCTMRGGVAVQDGRVAVVAPDSQLSEARRTLDLDGRILLPGLFDPHVHLGMGGVIDDDTMVEDFRHNTRDFLVGGVTTLATTTIPGGPQSIEQAFDRAVRCAEGKSWCDYKFTSIPSFHNHVAEIGAITARGGTDFKFFTGFAGEQAADMGYNPQGISLDMFFLACEQIARSGAPAFAKIHAEDPFVRGVLIDRLKAAGRGDKLIAWAESSPEWSESLQVYSYGLIANSLGVPLYPVHVSSAHTVVTIRRLQAEGMNIIGETVVAFLLATAPEMEKAGMGEKAKIQPPIRFDRDRDALWQGVRDGTISVVGTDSLTYTAKYRNSPDFWDCRVGLHLQAADTLALMYDEGVRRRRIDLVTLAKVLSENAARLYGLFPTKGAIVPGADADLVVFDPDRPVLLGAERYRGHTDYSIWEGRQTRGAAVMTFLRGHLVMQDGEVVAEGPTGLHLAAR